MDLMLNEKALDPNFRAHLTQALVVSLLLHIVGLWAIQVKPPKQVIAPIEISFVPQPTKKITPEKQYVSPSAVTSETPPPDTNRLSEHNSVAKVESIHRGEEGKAKASSEKQAHPNVSSPAPFSAKNSTANLRLSPNEIANKLASEKAPPKLSESLPKIETRSLNELKSGKHLNDTSRMEQLERAEPFEHSDTSLLFSKQAGSMDYLPDIKDGDVTLLNAKADRFAVFVRRVALQVFGNLRAGNWLHVARREVSAIAGFVTVEAILTKDGNLESVTLAESSGSGGFDSTVINAAQVGARDQNPPPTAVAADGKIHFIFKAKAWGRIAGDPPREQRWLLLSTGLL